MEAQADYTTAQQRLITHGAGLVRDAVVHGSTDAKVELARVLVDLRATFEDSKGRPDYAGRSYVYRGAVNAVYEASELDRSRTEAVRVSVRHQVGLELRKRLTPVQLADYGLNPVDRNTPRRKGASGPDDEQATEAGSFADRVAELHTLAVALVDSPEASTVDADTAEKLRVVLADTAAACGRLRARLTPDGP
ncbi:hypothetical protein ATK36_3177 [Amycolatopsis sulphurea]|uniref:Uncharacterized protein n=1 Tax=Amycolatopsis sulphurea TaxID=76022 RepID=A0A2A9FAX5_9PSEU|nr:hypothetical protein [Amycolatopsis sulphurea]PFG48103.1 hypothetical protein ATK36_3177 [Amycolatopsis sulphurea]